MQWRDDNSTLGIYVQDSGEGANAPDDIVALVPDETMCEDFEPSDDENWALARGNAQVRDRA